MLTCCAESASRNPNNPRLVKRYTGLTIEIENFRLMDSFACGSRGEALFDQWLIPLGFADSVAVHGQEIAKVFGERNGDFSTSIRGYL
jgi:hypothetical protein